MTENPFGTFGCSLLNSSPIIAEEPKLTPEGNDFLSGEVRHYKAMDDSELSIAEKSNKRLQLGSQITTTIYGSWGLLNLFNSEVFTYKNSLVLSSAVIGLMTVLDSDMRSRAITIVKALRKG